MKITGVNNNVTFQKLNNEINTASIMKNRLGVCVSENKIIKIIQICLIVSYTLFYNSQIWQNRIHTVHIQIRTWCMECTQPIFYWTWSFITLT